MPNLVFINLALVYFHRALRIPNEIDTYEYWSTERIFDKLFGILTLILWCYQVRVEIKQCM